MKIRDLPNFPKKKGTYLPPLEVGDGKFLEAGEDRLSIGYNQCLTEVGDIEVGEPSVTKIGNNIERLVRYIEIPSVEDIEKVIKDPPVCCGACGDGLWFVPDDPTPKNIAQAIHNLIIQKESI